MSDWSSLRKRSAGKWQIPLLLLSVFALGAALYKLRPPTATLPLSDAASYLATLVEGGMYDRALKLGETLIHREEDTEADRAPVYLQLARARYGEAERLGWRSRLVGNRIVKDYRRASSSGERLTAQDYLKLGRALEWGDRFADAVEAYEGALERGIDGPLALRKRIIELSRDHLLVAPRDLDRLLTTFIADLPNARLDLRLWAIEEELFALDALNRLEDGATLLARNAERFLHTDYRDRFGYLEALLLYESGFYDEAEIRLRTVRNRTGPNDPVYAMTGWLLGRVVMYDDGPKRPQEALSFFEDVLRHHANSAYGVASRVGVAEALALLQRHEEGVLEYQVALEDLPKLRDRRLVNRDVLRASLGVTAELARRSGEFPAALSYARLAASLIDRENIEQATLVLQQLAQIQTARAEQLIADAEALRAEDPGNPKVEDWTTAARRLFSEGADVHADIAQLNVLNDRLASRASWRAAELAARAGERSRAARLFHTFMQERPNNPLVPRALLRIGQLRRMQGDLDSAIEAFQEGFRRYPRSLDGAAALIPLAECYLAKGPEGVDLAEKTLRIVIEASEVFTPDAPEFTDALFLLGETQIRKGAYEDAIVTVEEVLARYPDDPRVWRARYLLADAYRQSARALKVQVSEARSSAEIEQLRDGFTARFTAARVRFRELISEFETRDPDTLSRLERLYLRHAYFYEADCYFETQDYRTALKLYEEAAGLHKDDPSGLTAYVQIVNCHVFLGQPAEARAALSRALVVADAVPERVFAESLSPETRADWKRYFEWLGASELF